VPHGRGRGDTWWVYAAAALGTRSSSRSRWAAARSAGARPGSRRAIARSASSGEVARISRPPTHHIHTVIAPPINGSPWPAVTGWAAGFRAVRGGR